MSAYTDGALIERSLKGLATREAQKGRLPAKSMSPSTPIGISAEVTNDSHGGNLAEISFVALIGDVPHEIQEIEATLAWVQHEIEVIIPGYVSGETVVPPQRAMVTVRGSPNNRIMVPERQYSVRVSIIRGVDYMNLRGVYSDDADGMTFESAFRKSKTEDEDEEAIDRLFGTKAYGTARPTETITG